MAGLAQIRNVPDDTRRELKARAAMRGVSLDDLLLDLLVEQAPRPTLAGVLAPWRDVLDRYDQLPITRGG